MNVIEYITEEVRRQGHDVTQMDGIERVGWMIDAWTRAVRLANNLEVQGLPRILDVIDLGKRIEPQKNANGLRTVGVRVGSRPCPAPSLVPGLLADLFRQEKSGLSPMEFYREFELIHPFLDGNGRTGKILLNWANGTLLDPIFPPADLFGHPIQNP